MEGPLVEQQSEALASSELALLVLAIHGTLAARVLRFLAQPAELFNALFSTQCSLPVASLFDSATPKLATHYAGTHLPMARSTQDEARARFDGSQPILVTAAQQSDGRGRNDRTWWSAPRPLAASVAFTPQWSVSAWPRVSLVAGLAIREVIGNVDLKWPNDIIINGVKVGGILAEADQVGVVVGLGLNLWWPDPPPGVGAISTSDPGAERPVALAEEWATALLGRMNADEDEWGRDEYLQACVTVGQEISWDGGTGTAIGVGADGGLVVSTGRGDIVLSSGEVQSVRPTTLTS